jgi:hypothetical protein
MQNLDFIKISMYTKKSCWQNLPFITLLNNKSYDGEIFINNVSDIGKQDATRGGRVVN